MGHPVPLQGCLQAPGPQFTRNLSGCTLTWGQVSGVPALVKVHFLPTPHPSVTNSGPTPRQDCANVLRAQEERWKVLSKGKHCLLPLLPLQLVCSALPHPVVEIAPSPTCGWETLCSFKDSPDVTSREPLFWAGSNKRGGFKAYDNNNNLT